MKAYALTDIGKTRKVNQDAQFASTEPVGELSNLFVVADGMGGHQAGDFASRYLIEHMPEYIKESGENEPVAALRKGIEAVNQIAGAYRLGPAPGIFSAGDYYVLAVPTLIAAGITK